VAFGLLIAFSACGGESRSVSAGNGGSAGNVRPGGVTAANGGVGVGQGGASVGTGGTVFETGGASPATGGTGVEAGGAPPATGGVGQAGAVLGSGGFGVGGAAGRPASGTGGDAGAPLDQTESIPDADGNAKYPSLANMPAAFYWSGGLGNWFVCTPGGAANTGPHGDAQSAEIVPPRGDSHEAFRLQASGLPFGADLYAQLEHPSGSAVDLSAYAGIGFWAKLDGASDQLSVGLSATAPLCATSSDVTTVTVSVPNTWQKFELPFEAFGIDGHAVANVEFIAGAGGGAFDLWIDELSLLCRGECPTDP
jgi:hypothetical protein